MKSMFALLVLTLSLIACERTGDKRGDQLETTAKLPVTIVYDREDSIDLSAGSDRRCPRLTPQQCRDVAEQWETTFLTKLSTQVQMEPACHGVRLLIVGGREFSQSRQAQNEYEKLKDRGYWSLLLGFVTEEEQQQWSISFKPAESQLADGEGTAESIAHSACSIVKGVGGSVIWGH